MRLGTAAADGSGVVVVGYETTVGIMAEVAVIIVGAAVVGAAVVLLLLRTEALVVAILAV